MDRVDIAMLFIASLPSIIFTGAILKPLQKLRSTIISIAHPPPFTQNFSGKLLYWIPEKNIHLHKDEFQILERQAEFGRLSEGILHDLMNPLTSISLHLEKISSDPVNVDNTKDSIEKVVDISKKMNQFMGSVRSVIGTKNNDDVTYQTKVSDSISAIIDIYRYKLRFSNIHISKKCKKQITLSIHPIRLNQLLMNLISNSIDSFNISNNSTCKRRKIRNFIKVIVTENLSEKYTSIEVIDNGKGMDDIQMKMVFNEPFTNKPNGSGVGLVTVKNIVKKDLRSKIFVESKVGVGTKILIKIPHQK